MLHSHRFRWPLLCLTLACTLLAGCEVFQGDDDDDDDRGTDRIGRTDRRTDTTTGVPATASRVEEGRGELSYRAEDDGTVYLYDADGRLHLDTQRVKRGQRYTIAPDRDVATLDGRIVWDRDMDPKHTHRIYFDRGRD
jgi:hypothetical protein